MLTSLALGQSYDCPSASEISMSDMDEIDHYLSASEISMTDMDEINHYLSASE